MSWFAFHVPYRSRGEDVCCRDIFLTRTPHEYVDIDTFQERMW